MQRTPETIDLRTKGPVCDNAADIVPAVPRPIPPSENTSPRPRHRTNARSSVSIGISTTKVRRLMNAVLSKRRGGFAAQNGRAITRRRESVQMPSRGRVAGEQRRHLCEVLYREWRGAKAVLGRTRQRTGWAKKGRKHREVS
jgi:hypothetical protein